MEELRDAIALLFKRKGRDELSEREFVLSASMDLRWFPPRDAQRLLQIGLETKLLESHDGPIRPGFDVSKVEVPRDYVPTTAILSSPTPAEEDLFVRIVDGIAAKTGMDRKAVIRRVNEVQEEMDVEAEVRLVPSAGFPRLADHLGELLDQLQFAALRVHVLRRQTPLAGLQPLGDDGRHRARSQRGARHLFAEAGALPAHRQDSRLDRHTLQPGNVRPAQFADHEPGPQRLNKKCRVYSLPS